MNVIVVGCGRVGAALAYQLHKKGHQVTVIDQGDSAFDNLPPDFNGRTVEGERGCLGARALHAERERVASRHDGARVVRTGATGVEQADRRGAG